MLDYLLVGGVALLASALTLFSGFGLGTLLMPVLALLFPLPVAIAATAIVHLANNLFKLVLVAIVAAFTGAYLGVRLLDKVTLHFVRGTVAIMMVVIGVGLASGFL